MEDLETKLQEFRIWALTEGRYAMSTTARAVRRIRELSKKINVIEPKQEEILNFFAKEKMQGKKPHTLNNQRKDLEAWFRFLGKNIVLPKFKEPPTPEPQIPSDEEIIRILKAARNVSLDKGVRLRTLGITYIAIFGGARIGEIVNINLDDVKENGIRIRSEKGEKERFIGLPDQVMKDIWEYINYYRIPSDPTALFTTKKGRMNYNYVRNLAKRLGLSAGVKNFHWHAARHWNATALLRGIFGEKPMDIRMVQIHLGHASLKTTERYTHISQIEVEKEVRDRLSKLFRENKIILDGMNPNMNTVGPAGFEPTANGL